MEAEVFDVWQKLLGLLTMLRRRFMGDQDTIMLILDDHHTVVRAQRIIAVKVTRRRRGEGQQLLQHLLGRGHMRAKSSHPAFDRRLCERHQEQGGKKARKVPETPPAHDREGTGQPDHAVAQMLGGRDPLHLGCEGHPLVLVVQGGHLARR